MGGGSSYYRRISVWVLPFMLLALLSFYVVPKTNWFRYNRKDDLTRIINSYSLHDAVDLKPNTDFKIDSSQVSDTSVQKPRTPQIKSQNRDNSRKFFIDCGANTGSTYKLFHEIYPNAQEYSMISFEIDPNLKPFYADFVNHTAMVPLGVSDKNGSMEAHLEPPWSPERKKLASKWGGGSLFAWEGKKEWRGLQRLVKVPTFDLSHFITKNFKVQDEVILKIDIEGAEYNVIKKLLDDGTFKLVDQFFLEFHDWQPTGWSKADKDSLRARMKSEKVVYSQWDAEYPEVPDASTWSPGVFDRSYRKKPKCHSSNGTLKLAIAVGMNARRARRLVATILAHSVAKSINVGLFVYRDFVYDHSQLVNEWLNDLRVVLGVRGDSPKPEEYFLRYNYEKEMDIMLISSQRELLKNTGFNTDLFLEDFEGNKALKTVLTKRNMKVASHPIWIPPKKASKLSQPFFSKRSVEKIPPVLEATYQELEKFSKLGGDSYPTVVLDADFDETWISSVFLLDYFASTHAVENGKTLSDFINC
ncbi:uncharacterized protein LOC134844620 isoform X3 [Symsagittifera roscoffensis]